MLTQRHSSVFHAGVIGHGPRKPPPENSIVKEIINLNQTLLINVIKVNKEYHIKFNIFIIFNITTFLNVFRLVAVIKS